jgi:DNA-binding HxlR family transcriptional regulator
MSVIEPHMATLFELIGRAQTLPILWSLRQSPKGFRDLQRSCGDLSSSVVSRRLRELQAAKLVEAVSPHWQLTRQGVAFTDLLATMGPWAKRWNKSVG